MSINGHDISVLFKDPFNLQQEIKICNLHLNALSNVDHTNRKEFINIQGDLAHFSSRCRKLFACCIVEMFCQFCEFYQV